jgi:hypothetical protein
LLGVTSTLSRGTNSYGPVTRMTRKRKLKRKRKHKQKHMSHLVLLFLYNTPYLMLAIGYPLKSSPGMHMKANLIKGSVIQSLMKRSCEEFEIQPADSHGPSAALYGQGRRAGAAGGARGSAGSLRARGLLGEMAGAQVTSSGYRSVRARSSGTRSWPVWRGRRVEEVAAELEQLRAGRSLNPSRTSSSCVATTSRRALTLIAGLA